MGSVNKVILVGNLGKDPEIRSSQSGGTIANFTLATSESWKDRATGERREKVEWHRIVVFNDRVAETIERYLHKGDQVCVEGSLQTRKWTDQGGAEKYTTEVVVDQFRGEVTFLRTRSEEERSGADERPSRQPRQQRERPGTGGSSAPSGDDLDDSIPF